MFEYIFVGLFVLGVLLFFRVKFLLKKLYPEIHNKLFSKNLASHSVDTSFKFVRFSLRKSEWKNITNTKLLLWLEIYRVIAVIYYGIGIFAVLYTLFVIIQHLKK